MAKAMQCDRCRKLYSEQDWMLKNEQQVNHVKLCYRSPITSEDRVQTEIDICPDCAKELSAFFGLEGDK